MENETSNTEKETLLSATINELKRQLQLLRVKKVEVEQRLKETKGKLEITQEAEHQAEERMKDILKVEAKLEEFINEESRLEREKSTAESELFEIKKKLAKINELDKKIEGEDSTL